MKKHKLIKSLLFTPLATIPLVAAVGCGTTKTPSKPDSNITAPEEAAANALLKKFAATEASKFVSLTNADQKAAYSDFLFSTSKTDKDQAPTKDYFLKMLTDNTKGVTSGDNTKYTYVGDGQPYLYIWVQENLQDPLKSKGTMAKKYVVFSEFNENFTVSVKNNSKATDNAGTITLNGYKKGDEVAEFKKSTADSELYISNMLYALSLEVINHSSEPVAVYKAAVAVVRGIFPFDAKTTFEGSSVGTFKYTSSDVTSEVTYDQKDTATFKYQDGNEISYGIVYQFKSLSYNLNTNNGVLTIKTPVVASFY